MPSRQTFSERRTYYCRLRGASTGRAIVAFDITTARKMFAKREDISVASPYITICFKPTKGVVYGS